MSRRISIRNAPRAKQGLRDLCDWLDERIDLSSSTLVEIGSYVGDSTEIFAERFAWVYAVDPWRNGYDNSDAASYQHPMAEVERQFDALCDRYRNIIKCKMTSKQASVNLETVVGQSIDVVYIDGLHTYEGCADDIALWLPLVTGYLAGHDYQNKFPGVKQAVDERGGPHAIFADSSWVIPIDELR